MHTARSNHRDRRSSDDASLRTIDMPDIAQMLQDNNDSDLRDSMPNTLQQVQNASGMKSGDAIPPNVSVGLLSCDNNNAGHRQQQQRRNSLDSTMSDLSVDGSFGQLEDGNYETFFHREANAIPYSVNKATSVLDSGMPTTSNYPAFGLREYATYDGRHVKADSIPNTAADANNSHRNYWFRYRRRSTLDSGISIASNPEDRSSFCMTGSNKCDTAHQDTCARANTNRTNPAKPHSYSPREFNKEMRLLMSLMNASARSRTSVRDIKMEMYRDFLNTNTSATARALSHRPSQDTTDTDTKSKDEKRHSDFGCHSRREKQHSPRKLVKKSSPGRKYKRIPNSPSTI